MRLYVRDSKTWRLLGWEGQAVLSLLLRRMDRAGLLDDVHDAEDVAVMIGYGFPEEIAEKGLQRLLKRKTLIDTDMGLLMPNYIEAQEAAQSDKQRQRECRARRRDEAKQSVTKRDTGSQSVKKSHGESQSVTSCHSVPSRTVPNLSNPRNTERRDRKEKTPKSKLDVLFDAFWVVYPKKVGKKDARRAFEKAHKSGMGGDVVEKLTTQMPWITREGGKYIPNPSTWLNQGRWDDEPPAEVREISSPTHKVFEPEPEPVASDPSEVKEHLGKLRGYTGVSR